MMKFEETIIWEGSMYKQLTYEQRCQIGALKKRGDRDSAIARQLDVHRSTINREHKRNGSEHGYSHEEAQRKFSRRKFHRPYKLTAETQPLIIEKLKQQWSPEQIAGWLKKQGDLIISYKTIYKFIWEDKRKGGTLYRELRHNGKKYNKRGGKSAGRGCIPNRVDIEERPAIVNEKTRVGDWELDTIIGVEHDGAIVSMVDRATKLTKLAKVSRKTADEVKAALLEKLNPIAPFVLTLTSDNGKEFAEHEYISNSLEADFFFAKPYHSWERGLNEHTNGLVRQYLPKKTKFSEISQCEVSRIEWLLNERPRKVLGYRTPNETFQFLSTFTTRLQL